MFLSTILQDGVLGDSPYHNSNCADGRRSIVHLFEWKFSDVARECEDFLAPMGYCGVQLSPVHECAVITESNRPWWERYQPISYELTSRSGNEQQLADMIRRCNNVGVRIYVDVILNHMAGVGREGHGTGGNYFHSSNGDFPAVPYTMDNFNTCDNCPACCCINQWTDHNMVRNCRLEGLIDMAGHQEYVRQTQADYLNKLLSLGVAGFRVDAAKHMWPADIESILSRLNGLSSEFFSGGSPFIYNEVIDQSQNGEIRAQEYIHLGRVSEFRYSTKIRETVHALWMIPGLYDPGWGMLEPDDAFVFVDNHDSQRGHGAGSAVYTFKNPLEYKMAQAITLGWTYGFPRVMSSYEFENTEAGPPTYDGDAIMDVEFDASGNPLNGWVCEHRWQAIAGMASFAKAVSGEAEMNYWSGGNSAAWSRGAKGYFAITNEGGMNQWMYTGLPAGDYCNVIQGCPTSNGCIGDTVRVESDGMANIRITNPEEPIFAIHVEAMSGSDGCINAGGAVVPPPEPTPPPPTPGQGSQHTVIFIRSVTQVGQDLFLRGGIGHDRRAGCSENAATSPCALSIVHAAQQTNEGYDAWKIGDTKLDWYGAEAGQGSYNGRRAEGSPAIWTDRNHPLNNFGDHYWMLDIELNCDETENGWFEVKAVILQSGGSVTWEGDINQSGCQGSAGGTAPYSSGNHMARCGFLNVFEMNSGSCTIDNM